MGWLAQHDPVIQASLPLTSDGALPTNAWLDLFLGDGHPDYHIFGLLPIAPKEIQSLSMLDMLEHLMTLEAARLQAIQQSGHHGWGIRLKVWAWLEKACPHRFESCYLLAGFPYATLTDELKRRVLRIQATYAGRPESLFMGHLKEEYHTIGTVDVDAAKTREAYYHWALLFAMGYRMSFKEYADEWLQEETQWVQYYVHWPEDIRVYILEALSCLPLERCQGFLKRHLRVWFPHAAHVIDAAEAVGEHPARAVLVWVTETRNADAPDEISLVGVL